MMDIAKNDGNENKGISPLLKCRSQGTGVANKDASFGPIQVGQRSVASQTLSRSQLNKLVAAGKLSKRKKANPREENRKAPVKRGDDNSYTGEPQRVMTSRLGVKIVKAENQDEDYNADKEEEEGNAEQTDQLAEPTKISNQGGPSRGPSAEKGKTDRPIYLAYETVTDDSDFEYLSGISRANFQVLYGFLKEEVASELNYETEKGTFEPLRCCRMSLKGRLFMTLCHLRRGFSDREISIMFGCSEDQVSSILNTWVNFIYLELKCLEDVVLQNRKSQKQGMSSSFESSKQLKVIVVCTDIRVEAEAPSEEINCNTVKYLVGISVHGAFLYVSEAFNGAMPDKEVFMQSSLYELLRPGDVVVADGGFDVAHELDSLGVKLIIPSYSKGRDDRTPEEEKEEEDMEEEEEDMEEEEGICTMKVHIPKVVRTIEFVEKAIGRLREWRALNQMFPQSIVPFVSRMMFACAYLTNFKPALL